MPSGYVTQTGKGTFTEVKFESVRAKDGDCGVCDAFCFSAMGFILIIASMIVIFSTERDFVERSDALSLLDAAIREVNGCDLALATSLADTNEPVLVRGHLAVESSANFGAAEDHFLGQLHEFLQIQQQYDGHSEDTGMGAVVAICRTVEMLQWVEHKSEKRTVENKENKAAMQRVEVEYKYSKEWDTALHNSDSFRFSAEYWNPRLHSHATLGEKCWMASTLSIDSVLLSENLKRLALSQMKRTANDWRHLGERSQLEAWHFASGYLHLARESEPSADSTVEGEVEPGANAHYSNRRKARVGDLRMTVSVADNFIGRIVTALGALKRRHSVVALDSYRPMAAASSVEWTMFEFGHWTKQRVLRRFADALDVSLFAMRGLSLCAMVAGFVLSTSLLKYLLSFVPLCGALIGSALSIVAATLGAVFWCLLFAVAYVFAKTTLSLVVFAAFGIALAVALWQSYHYSKPKVD